jgi:competence protein ComGC
MRAEGRSQKSEVRSQKLPVRSSSGPAPAHSVSCLLSPVSSLRAFTLVELTIVVAIIALLVGIMIPAVSKVHKAAKAAGTKAVLSAVGTGLEMFKGDGNVGGDYPPSYSDADGTTLDVGEVANPYESGPASFGGLKQMPGAGLLVWGLAGADQLGAPGFKAFRTGAKFWSDDTDKKPYPAVDRTASGAYALDAQDRPLQPRSGPYLDMSKVQITAYEVAPNNEQGYVVPAETNARGSAYYRKYPLLLDSFGCPILYWKADPAGNRIVDQHRADYPGPDRGIYHWEDNWALLERVEDFTGRDPLKLTAYDTDVSSVLHWDDTWAPAKYDANPASDNGPPAKTFADFIINSKITAKLVPYRPDSYLLVSPGVDGEYGTADDVTNFR